MRHTIKDGLDMRKQLVAGRDGVAVSEEYL